MSCLNPLTLMRMSHCRTFEFSQSACANMSLCVVPTVEIKHPKVGVRDAEPRRDRLRIQSVSISAPGELLLTSRFDNTGVRN